MSKTVNITPTQMESMSITIWGTDWRQKILPYLGISYSQLHRYMTVYGGQSIPRPVALAMHYAHDSIVNDKPLPTLPEIPASEVRPVKFTHVKKPKPERVNNDAPEIDIFGDIETEEPDNTQQAEDPAPEPEKPEPAPKAAAKPKEKAPAKKPATPKAKAPAKPKAEKKLAPAKEPAEKKKPVRRAPAKKD